MAQKPTTPKPAKPTTTEVPKPKGRQQFALVGSKDENVYPFKEALPEGFNFATNKPLKKRDFASDYLFYEYRALELEFKAAAFRTQAEEVKKLGSAKDRNRAKRLVKLQEKMAELKKQLTEQGVDVEELLASATSE